MSTEQILREALALPAESKVELAEQLLASLDGPDGRHIDAAWGKEAEDRIDAYEAGKLSASPAQEVFRRLRERNRP